MIHTVFETTKTCWVDLYYLRNQTGLPEWVKAEILGMSFYPEHQVTLQVLVKGCIYSYIPLFAVNIAEDAPLLSQTYQGEKFLCPLGGEIDFYSFPTLFKQPIYVKGVDTPFAYILTIDFLDQNRQVYLLVDSCGQLRVAPQPHITVGEPWHNRLGLQKQRSEWR